MAKKILALAVAMIMVLATFTVVNANAVMTLTANDVDATAIADGGNVDVLIDIDAIPKAKIQMIQIYFDIDETKLTFDKAMRVMQVWDADYEELANATWTSGADNVLFNDGTYGLLSFDNEHSLPAGNTLLKLRFKKVAGATGETTVDITNVIVTALEADNEPANKGEYSLAAGTLAAVDATVSFGGEIEPLDATWVTATDAGYYNTGADVFGLIRFLFDVTVDGEVTATGIKFLKENDITAVIDGTNVTGTAKTFYGDVTGITEAEAKTVYAVAYVTVGDQTVWSDPVSCTPNFVKAVIK